MVSRDIADLEMGVYDLANIKEGGGWKLIYGGPKKDARCVDENRGLRMTKRSPTTQDGNNGGVRWWSEK